MGSDALTAAVVHCFKSRAERYGLMRDSLRAEPALNWGGFVNAHFVVTDGARAYHLKLARDREGAAGMERWRRFASMLEARYRAPHIIEWFDLPGTPFAGLLFERSAGRPLELERSPAIVLEAVALLDALHRDADLARALRAQGIQGDARGSVLHRYVECMEADLTSRFACHERERP